MEKFEHKFELLLKRCLLLLLLAVGACRENIVHNLAELEANRLLSGLHEIGLDAEKVKQNDGKWSIAVEHSDTIRAIRHLNDSRMLRDNAPELKKSGLISTREDQHFKFERALSSEIEYTLASVNHVLEARVHLNLPPIDPVFGQPLLATNKGSGSVLLVTNDDFALTDKEVSALVGGAAGIDANSISVLISKQHADLRADRSVQSLISTNPKSPETALAPAFTDRLASMFLSTSAQLVISVLIISAGLIWILRGARQRRRQRLQTIAEVFSKQPVRGGAHGI